MSHHHFHSKKYVSHRENNTFSFILTSAIFQKIMEQFARYLIEITGQLRTKVSTPLPYNIQKNNGANSSLLSRK